MSIDKTPDQRDGEISLTDAVRRARLEVVFVVEPDADAVRDAPAAPRTLRRRIRRLGGRALRRLGLRR